MKRKSDDMLKTLDLALKVIKMFTKQKPEWGGRELANELGMDHAKIYRILETFEANNFISKDPVTKKYTLGFAVLELGMIKYEGLNVKQLVSPVLEKLSDQTGESTFLTSLYKNEGVTLEAIEPENKVKYSVTVGSRAPLYVGASYRSMLAYMPEDFIKYYLETEELKRYTDKTMTIPSQIASELELIRKQGWAISKGEFTPDIIAIAVPLFDSIKGVIGSVTVAGPAYRMTDERIKEYLPILQARRDELTEIIDKYQLKLQI